ILLKGIKVGDKVFKFFAASNSQQRNGGLYLTNLDQNSLYSTLGDFSSLPNAAKTMSRIGLSLGSSLATISIPFNKNMMIDDVKNDKYCFTDGIGMISPDLASEITKLMGVEKCPSAFQIRYAGFKGVLAVNPNAKGILFRPSMKKFESKYSHIDVLNYSKPQNLTLNRQSIAILSHLGISDETFEMIHDHHLFSLIDSFNDPHTAHCLLKEHLNHHLLDVSLIKSKCNLLFDHFFQKMLHNLVLYQINSLKTKACIPVEKGRNMIGVVDEYDILDYGKVFVQYTDDNENCEIVKGKVVVYRCPLSRASDVLVLEAIDVPELRHLKDVIVFPRKGV
ncbi:RdRP-domain-containing protein, partial [Rozella allomycis CSF55]